MREEEIWKVVFFNSVNRVEQIINHRWVFFTYIKTCLKGEFKVNPVVGMRIFLNEQTEKEVELSAGAQIYFNCIYLERSS